ncbi:hypothetical protein BC830DRAFT_1126319 [Chytriomyces sp. MP71]|nr:hypothetical protein BC830DRAFT_1126319 [Chytriomyces sp. MP71]
MLLTLVIVLILGYVGYKYYLWRQEHMHEYNPSYDSFLDDLRTDTLVLLRTTIERLRDLYEAGSTAAVQFLAQRREAGRGGGPANHRRAYTRVEGNHTFLFDEELETHDGDVEAEASGVANLTNVTGNELAEFDEFEDEGTVIDLGVGAAGGAGVGVGGDLANMGVMFGTAKANTSNNASESSALVDI